MPDTPPPISQILEQRSDQALSLNNRYLNRQLGRSCARSASIAIGATVRARI